MIAGGEHHSIGLTVTGKVYCWGRNDESQCGKGDLYNVFRANQGEQQGDEEPDLEGTGHFHTPVHVQDALTEKKITNIAAGSNFCYALDQIKNEVYSWGMGYNYVLGTREEETEHIPVKVHAKMFHELPVKVIAPGS